MAELGVGLEDVIKVRDLERTLNELPGVEEAAVLIEVLPDGEKEFAAFVQLDGSRTVEKETLVTVCRQKTNVALKIEFCELPKTPTGKVARHLLKPASGQ